MVVGPTLPPFD